MHLHNVTPDEIKKWVMQNAYQMDSPGVLALQEQTSVIRDWNEEPYKSDLKFCLSSPVEYASVVSNLGMAILYQEINQNGKHPTTSGVLCERAYFPEKKLLTRLEKKGWPLFSKETFVPLCNFEVLAFSSYYPLQYFNVPRMLEMSSIPAWAKDRNGSNAPIIMGGGISFFNPEPVSDFFDCFFIGEGEEKLLHVLQIAKECRTEDGIDKEKYLYRLAKETDYMYVPSFYDVKYFSGFGVKSRTSKIPEAKPIIRRALANIYDIEPLTRTFVPVCDSADMSISSVEISRGCSASCNFCEGSARTMPLRERPLDVSLKAFDEVHKETGCFDTTPYGFNLSDHSNIRAMLNYLAKDQDVKIQMSSQRIDMFTEDFASLAYATGNRSVTLAVEGGSERMRRAVNKNLTTQQILEAFEIAMKIGFNKVKIYMIANLPFERSEDIDGTPSQLVSIPYEGAVQYHEEDAVYITFEDNTFLLVSKNYVFYKKLGETTADQLQDGDEIFVDETLKKVKFIEHREADLYGPEKNEEDSLVGLMKKLAARRDYWKQQHGGKETVLNWSFTPFTSKNQTPFEFASCMGGLTNRKTLTPAVEAARHLGFKFRVGTAADVSTVAQVMTLGDRRLNKVIYRAYKEGIIQYFGGMGIGKDVLPAFENLLKEEVGHTYDVYGGEKMLHQIFPWDFIDAGMDKTHLKERYLQAKAATNSPFGCFNRCVSCGACMVDAYHLPKTPSGKEYRPFIWRKEVCTGDTLDNVNLIIKSAKKQDVARYILRVDVFDENMRYLNAKKMKFYINRAFFRAGFPARKKKVFLSDKFKYKNYSYGIDYCIGQLTEKPTISSEELVEKFNKHLVPFGIRAERLEIYSMATKAADISEFFMSEIQTDFDISKVKSAIEEFLASDSCIVKVKQQGMMRDSWITVDVDARPHVKDIWAEQLNGVTIIRMISEAPVSFYQLLPAILKTSQKNIMRFPVRRLEYFKLEDEGALDFFDETCEVSGNTIEKNPFDEQISDRFCARYLPFDSALATFGGEFTEEDEKADELAAAIESPEGQALSPEHDIVDIEGEGDEFESEESYQDNE